MCKPRVNGSLQLLEIREQGRAFLGQRLPVERHPVGRCHGRRRTGWCVGLDEFAPPEVMVDPRSSRASPAQVWQTTAVST